MSTYIHTENFEEREQKDGFIDLRPLSPGVYEKSKMRRRLLRNRQLL
nr:hypothetical protein [Peribacillus saganii]